MSSLPELIVKNDHRVVSLGPGKPVLRFIALHPSAALPEANGDDAMALDLRAVDDYNIPSLGCELVNFGIVLSPESRQYTIGQQLSLRSGFAMKEQCLMLNGVGLIERSFAGFDKNARLHGISAFVHNTQQDCTVCVEGGERIAQLLVYGADGRVLLPNVDFDVAWDTSYYSGGASFMCPSEWAERLGPNAGGRGGFGSSGRN